MPIRSIPIECLCPKCEAGYMIKSNMPAATKTVGRFKRHYKTKCDRCGYEKRSSMWYVGKRSEQNGLPLQG